MSNELPRHCLNALRLAGRPMHVREISAAALAGKGLNEQKRRFSNATEALAEGFNVSHRRQDLIGLPKHRVLHDLRRLVRLRNRIEVIRDHVDRYAGLVILWIKEICDELRQVNCVG